MKILLVDDHALFREGLCHILHDFEPDASIFQSHDYEHALEYIEKQNDFDLALVDLNLPGKNGFELLSSISSKFPTIPVVILSESNLRSNVQQSLELGAMGYITKDTPSITMLNALRLILSGGIYIPECFARPDPKTATSDDQNTLLTPRQLDVLALIAKGHSNKSIANSLQLTEGTIKSHITAIFKTLNVSNRTQAVIAANIIT